MKSMREIKHRISNDIIQQNTSWKKDSKILEEKLCGTNILHGINYKDKKIMNLNGGEVNEVEKFKYLGSVLQKDDGNWEKYEINITWGYRK